MCFLPVHSCAAIIAKPCRALMAHQLHDIRVEEAMINSLVLALSFLVVACVDDSSDPLMTSDSQGNQVAVLVGDHQLDITSSDRSAIIVWSEREAHLLAVGEDAVFARVEQPGWQAQAIESTLAPYVDMVGAAEQRAHQHGVVLPWRSALRRDGTGVVPGQCETTSTWTWGSSCTTCYLAVFDLLSYGPSWRRTNSTCSSGAIWTSCSETYCRRGD